jgi:tetratricopeptide (TPR) repeat protein
MTIVAQHHGNALAGLERAPLSHRLLNAAASYLGYIVNTLWPVRLAAFYPVPASSRFLTAAAGLLVLAAVTIFVFRAGQRHGFLLTGWLWYVGALIPVIGLVQVGEQAMADRYTYVPLAGLFLIAAWGVPELVGKWRYGRVVLPVLAVCAGTACVAVARAQVQYWSGNIPLWQHTLDVTGDNPLAQTHLGTALLKQGKADEAIPHLAEALRLLPQLAWAQYNMGSALLQQGKADEATPYFLEALRLKPHDADAHFNLGSALTRQQRFTEAIAEYAEALRLQPDHPEAHNNLGGLLLRLGRTAEAIPHITEALRLKPDYAEAHNNLGGTYLNQGSIAEAIPHFTEALRIKPDFALAQNNLGIALMQQGRRDEAAQHFAEAVRIEPGYDEARENLSIALGQQEQAGGAAAPDLNALALPRDAETLNDLGVMLARQGNMEEAAKKFAEALRINPGFTMASNNLKRALARLGRNSRNSGFVP